MTTGVADATARGRDQINNRLWGSKWNINHRWWAGHASLPASVWGLACWACRVRARGLEPLVHARGGVDHGGDDDLWLDAARILQGLSAARLLRYRYRDLLGDKVNALNNLSVYFVGGILLYAYITSAGLIIDGMTGMGSHWSSVLFTLVFSVLVWHSTRAVDRISVLLVILMGLSFVLASPACR